MGLFDIFSSESSLSVAEKLRDAALSTQMTLAEEEIASAIGVEPYRLLKERLLFRIGFTEASVSFFNSQQPHPKVYEVREHLGRMFLEYMLTRPGVAKEVGGELYTKATSEYFVKQPNELAATMMTNLFDGEYITLDPSAQRAFLQLVHQYARVTMTMAGELTKKLRG